MRLPGPGFPKRDCQESRSFHSASSVDLIQEPGDDGASLGPVHGVVAAEAAIALPVQHAQGVAGSYRLPIAGRDLRPVIHPALDCLHHRLVRKLSPLLQQKVVQHLLWSLRLEEGCFQTVGMGKPYGYGRMRLRIDRLRLLDDGRLYGGDLSADPWTDETDQVDRYIDRYDCSALAEAGGAPPARVRDQPEIQDFFFMKRTVRDGRDTSYMRLEEYRKVRTPLPAVRSIRDREEGRAEPGARPPKPPDRPDGEGRS